MVPTDRKSLVEYCLRKLGAPVVKINVTDDQVQDRIDEAITRFQSFHQDGQLQWYTSYQIQEGDAANGWIQMTSDIIGVTRIFTLAGSSTVSTGTSGFNMFDINYQIRLNELYDYTAGDYVYFELANEHLRMLEMMFTGEIPIRYNRYENKLYIDAIWSARFTVGQYLIIECYRVLDNTTTFYGADWLMKYATALIKRQWGENMSKFTSPEMPGGMVLNGQQIKTEAIEECLALEKSLRDDWELPAVMMIG